MTAAAAGRAAAGTVRSGPVTQAERANLQRRLAAAQAAQGGGNPRPAKAPAQKAPAAAPRPQPADPAPPAPSPAGPARPPTASTGRRWAPPGGVRAAVDSGAGFLLALVFWGWIALPLLKDGPTGVRNTIRAKFFNKAPDGTWLP